MVLEDMLTPQKAEKQPFRLFMMATLVTIFSIIVSYFFFPQNTGMILVFLIVIGMLPLFHYLIEFEEMKDEYRKTNKIGFVKRHSDIIIAYTAFFFGVAITISIISAILPEAFNTTIFADQILELDAVRNSISGQFFGSGLYQDIVLNNLRVLGIAFVLSFLFGTGALFVLSWNGSILGVLIGSSIKSYGPSGFLGLIAFLPHGILEITGFFTAGIAAGILSKSIFHIKSDVLKYILLDGIGLFILSIILIFVAAAVEVALI